VSALGETLAITDGDLFVVSPTPRTIETAMILAHGTRAARYASPSVGPRMFPQDPRFAPLLCDRTLEPEVLVRGFPGFELIPHEHETWWAEGINTIAPARFEAMAAALLQWCRGTGGARVVVVSHDGTIHNYRQLLGEKHLTRASFLGAAGWYGVTV
jgi:broad specificity phosphatase PhoE